jgi:RNA polymerase sigma-70 factor (ECF subfamily)
MTVENRQEPAANFSEGDLIALIPRMRSFARSLCRNTTQADDLTQDALTSAWRRRDSYVPGTNLQAWLSTIVRNQFYSDRRRSWRVTQLDPTVAEETLVAVSNLTGALELEDVRQAMQGLSDDQRGALTLIAVAGLDYNETAKLYRCAAGTIKSRVSRARQRLLVMLDAGVLPAGRGRPGDAMAAIIADADRLRLQAAA